MEFKFACPHCDQHLSASPADVGIVTTCPTCAQTIEVQPPPVDEERHVSATVTSVRWWRIMGIAVVICAFGLVILASVFRTPRVHPTSANSSPSVPADQEAPSFNTPARRPLTIKGLYVGMDIEEAIEAIKRAAEGAVETRPTKLPNQKGHDLIFHPPRWPTLNYGGGYLFTADGNTLREFVLLPHLTDHLFNSGDLSPAEFAQKLIDAYDIPKLNVINFQGRPEWRYESSQGWTIAVTQTKQINVWLTTKTKFD